jgi:LacI family transcriptional regulator
MSEWSWGLTVKTSRRAGTAPTLSDVARAAGVSAMTVSRVINKDARVRPETRERVDAAIAALNYAPNPAARVLAGAAQTRIALIWGNPSRGYLSEVLLGALSEASRSDAQLILENCADGQVPAAIIERAVARRLDGVLLPPPFCDDPALVGALLAGGVPVAVLATGAPAKDAFAVTIDDAQAAADMTRHLIRTGHRRIGFIVGDPAQTASARRLEGYRLALGEAGLPVDEALIAQGDFSYRSGLASAEQLLAASLAPTAIFASNDDMAAAAIAVAHRRHLEVPEQLTVCGFDDTALATTISPELTTVRQPVAQMAQAAVEMLIAAARRRRLGQPAPPEWRVFPHEIVRRRSDAAPQARLGA